MARPAAALVAIALLSLAAPARADVPVVRVRLPQGLASVFPGASPAADGNLYVTIPALRIFNPNSHDFGWYDPSQFHLIANERTYYPVTRPGLAALDLSNAGSVRPNGTLVVTVTFELPPTVTTADFEFLPQWFDNSGGSVAFCCYYQW